MKLAPLQSYNGKSTSLEKLYDPRFLISHISNGCKRMYKNLQVNGIQDDDGCSKEPDPDIQSERLTLPETKLSKQTVHFMNIQFQCLLCGPIFLLVVKGPIYCMMYSLELLCD
jgi:hypothetical protein